MMVEPNNDSFDTSSEPASPPPPEADAGSHSRLLKCIMIAIILGIIVGGWLPDLAVKFSILGQAFLNSLMMIVVPLIMLSMTVGITGLGDIRNLGSIGRRTIFYYLMTTGIAVMIGIIAVNVIRPGEGISTGEEHPDFRYTIGGEYGRIVTLSNEKWDRRGYRDKYVLILTDQNVRGPIVSVSDSSVTVKFWQNIEYGDLFYVTSDDGTRLPVQQKDGFLIVADPELAPSGTGVKIALSAASGFRDRGRGDIGSTLKEVLVGNTETGRQGLIPRNIFDAMVNMEMLPLIVFSLLLGATLSVLGERVHTTIQVISTLNDAVMKLVHWIMIVAPVGIFGLIAARIGRAGGFGGFLPELFALGKYSFTVLLGLAVHGFIILPLILKTIGGRKPGGYARGVGPALLNAFSTASSSATLPLTMQGVKEVNGISNRTASFVLPLGATVNMDGTALYESVAAIFIAQVYGIHLGFTLQVVIFLTATLAAIGAAGIPEAGLVTMVIVLKAVGLPIEGIGLLLAIDWLLDRFRTTVNVWGDSVGAAVVERLESPDGT